MAMRPAILGTATRLGNFRLGYQTAAMMAIRPTKVRITLADVPVRVRVGSVVIRDVANDAPNTCSLTVDAATPPVSAQRLHITINSDVPRLLFDGALETVSETYEGRPSQVVYACTAQDDTPRANRLIPLGYWEGISATTVAQELVAAFAPGFTSTHVQTGLSAVTVHFEGSEAGMNGCLRQIAKLIGGYFYWETRDLHLFTAESTDLPDDLDSTPGRFLDEPHITITWDDSQLRTRVYGKGHQESTLSEVDAGGLSIPLGDVSMYNPAGGKVISESQILTYTAISSLDSIGSTVAGEALSPGTPVSAVVAATAGKLGEGAYQYKAAFVLPAGESEPSSASGTATIAGISSPSAPSGAQTSGLPGNLGVGTYTYLVAYRMAAGRSAASGASGGVAIADITAPSAPSGSVVSGAPGNLRTGTYGYKTTYHTDAGETVASPASSGVTIANVTVPGAPTSTGATVAGGGLTLLGWYYHIVTYLTAAGETGDSNNLSSVTLTGTQNAIVLTNIPTSSDSRVIGRRIYRADVGGNGNRKFIGQINDNASGGYTDVISDGSRGAVIPSTNTSGSGKITVTIPVSGDARVITRSIYRTEVGGSTYYKLTTVTDNSDTSFVDNIADELLGGIPPATGTAGTGRITVTIPVSSDARVTGRVIFRKISTDSVYRKVGTVSENTSTSFNDNVATASLGDPEGAETSGGSGTGQIAVSSIPIGPAGTTARRIYRTEAGGTLFKFLRIVTGNVTTSFTDDTADSSLGETAPTGSTVGALAGSSSLRVKDLALHPASGWVRVGDQLIRYTGRSASSGEGTLTGIPASGVGAIGAGLAATVSVVNQAHLAGVSGIVRPLIKGAPVNIWVQRNDLTAQAELIAREGEGDGIIEHRIVDERRGEASLIALCDADLAQYARPLITVTYATRDVKTRSGKPIVIDLPSPLINETLTIQEVQIDQIDIAPGLAPRFMVTASSVRHSLEDLLRRMAGDRGGL